MKAGGGGGLHARSRTARMSSIMLWIKCVHAQQTFSGDEKVQEETKTGAQQVHV